MDLVVALHAKSFFDPRNLWFLINLEDDTIQVYY